MSRSAEDRTAVCVLGMSRSGTSLTARLLQLAGVYLGPEEELLGPELHQLAGAGDQVLEKARQSNPGGHWEHYRLMRLNERILRSLGGNWREPPPMPAGWESSAELDGLRDEAASLIAESFAGRPLWGWKDPRNSLTLPFWLRLIPRMRCVVCLRNPIDVAASLQRRDGMPVELGVELWRTYVDAALAATAGLPRLLVSYEAYFDDGLGAAARLARFVGRPEALEGGAEAQVAAAIDGRLWRNRSALDQLAGDDRLPGEVASIYRSTQRLIAAQERDAAR